MKARPSLLEGHNVYVNVSKPHMINYHNIGAMHVHGSTQRDNPLWPTWILARVESQSLRYADTAQSITCCVDNDAEVSVQVVFKIFPPIKELLA